MKIYPSILLYNKSLGCTNTICKKIKQFSSFSVNRKENDDENLVAILPILLWYSSNIIENAFMHAVNLINSMCSAANSLVVYAILTIDTDISNFLKRSRSISSQNCSKYNLCDYFLSLDYSYKLYSIGSSYKCTLIYGAIQQHIFSNKFVKSTIVTPHNECVFSGRYASAVNLYPALPYMLNIFDYFDYIIKYDIDNKISNQSFNLGLENLTVNGFYLAGCNLVYDSIVLSTNIFKMIYMYLCNLSMRCNGAMFGKGFSQNFIDKENIALHGRLTIMWLGLYNSPEVFDFLRYYVSYKEGIYKYRWGDQQFYLNALLLFSSKGKLGLLKSKLCNMHDIKMF